MQKQTHGGDVAIVGGGIIGATLAYLLARQGVSCCVLERGLPGAGTAEASAGIVGPHFEREQPEALRALLLKSLQAYPWLVGTLQDETPIDPSYHTWGELRLAFTAEQAKQLHDHGQWLESLGFDITWLDAAAVRADAPVVAEQVVGGLYLADAASMVVPRFVRSLLDAACRRGVTVLQQTPVLGFQTAGDRVIALQTGAAVLPVDQLVLAAGVETTALVRLLGSSVAIEPVRGQMLLLRATPGVLRMILAGSAGGYVVPRTDGDIWAGPTKERGRWEQQPTVDGLVTCLSILNQLAPGLRTAIFAGTAVGLRPGAPPDGLPVIGRLPGWTNVWIASGHEHLGVMLAPGTAELLVAALTGTETLAELSAFDPGRPAAWRKSEHGRAN